MHGVPVDLTQVEIVAHAGDVLGGDAVGGAPDALRRRAVVLVDEGGPVRPGKEGDDAAGGLGGAAVVFANVDI